MIFHGILKDSPLGTIHIYATQKGICSVQFTPKIFSEQVEGQETLIIQECKLQLQLYFQGKLEQFSIPTDISGTDFQCLVWNKMQKIKRGETISYKTLAASLGKPLAARAVGNACQKNPLLIIVPCHRVVGKNNSLTGYAGELWRKQWLLDSEKQTV